MSEFDTETDATLPLSRAVLCMDCELIRHAGRDGGRCPCGSDSAIPLGRCIESAAEPAREAA